MERKIAHLKVTDNSVSVDSLEESYNGTLTENYSTYPIADKQSAQSAAKEVAFHLLRLGFAVILDKQGEPHVYSN